HDQAHHGTEQSQQSGQVRQGGQVQGPCLEFRKHFQSGFVDGVLDVLGGVLGPGQTAFEHPGQKRLAAAVTEADRPVDVVAQDVLLELRHEGPAVDGVLELNPNPTFYGNRRSHDGHDKNLVICESTVSYKSIDVHDAHHNIHCTLSLV